MRWIRWAAAVTGLFVGAGVVAFAITSVGGVADAQTPELKGGPFARYEEVLAEKLGVSVETLRSAQKAARDELIDDAVDDGRLTEEQGEKLKALEPGAGLRAGLKFGLMQRGARIAHDIIGAVAEVLDIEREDVIEGLRGGKSIAELADEEGVSRSTLESELLDTLRGEIEKAEAAGNINSDQADRLSTALEERIDQIIDREGGAKEPLPGGPLGTRPFMERPSR